MSDPVRTMVVAVPALTGVLFLALAIPLMRRRIPPNGLFGLRVHATFADERVWYEANAASGRDLAVLGAIMAILAVILPLTSLGEETSLIIWTVVTVAGVLAMCVLGVRRANRLLRDIGGQAG